jgi:hypothetical protein
MGKKIIKCCDKPDVETLGWEFNVRGSTMAMDRCRNCGEEVDKYYEPELGQAFWGNSVCELDFDEQQDSYIVEYMLRVISYYATGDASYSGDFENDVFEMRSYYWGDDEEKEELPNFRHIKSGLEIRWYKYIGRGMSVNAPVCPKCFIDIFAECLNSLGGL